jgi:hypothetical protein
MLYQAINANIVKNKPILNDTKEAHDQTFDWIAWHGIFAEGGMGLGRYADSVMSLQPAE